MVSLARSTLLYEWRRFLPAMLAVAFSGLLVLIQVGLLLGLLATTGIYIDASAADLWVGYRDTQSVDLGRDISADNEVFLRMHSDVADVEKMIWNMGDWRRPNGGAVTTYLTGIDARPAGLCLAHILPEDIRARLNEPMTVAIDEIDQAKLGAGVGDSVEINKHRVRIVGLTRGLRAIGGVNVVTSISTARVLNGPLSREEKVTYFLLKLHHPENARRVCKELQPAAAVHPYSVFVARDFSFQSQMYWLLESGAGLGLGFSSLLGLIVGIVITSQTLMAAIIASIREYATLRALGVSLGSLAYVVLEQSAWVGAGGLIVTAATTVLTVFAAKSMHVAMALPWWSLAATAALVMAIALGSGLFALRSLSNAEPATLLR